MASGCENIREHRSAEGRIVFQEGRREAIDNSTCIYDARLFSKDYTLIHLIGTITL